MSEQGLQFWCAPTSRGCLGTQVEIERKRAVDFGQVKRWGKGRTFGNKAGWIVAETLDGDLLWGRMCWQDDAAAQALADVAKARTPQDSNRGNGAIAWRDK